MTSEEELEGVELEGVEELLGVEDLAGVEVEEVVEAVDLPAAATPADNQDTCHSSAQTGTTMQKSDGAGE